MSKKNPIIIIVIIALIAIIGYWVMNQSNTSTNEPRELSGDLEITTLVDGSGQTVVPGDVVVVDYVGRLEDGTEFDSSYATGRPFTFMVGQGTVIPGWDQGLIGMKIGEKRELIVPPAMAYGEEGIGPIPPNATLFFEVELLELPTVDIEVTEESDSDETAAIGSAVSVHYTGRLEDGTVFDTSDGGDPIQFVLGSGRVIQGWEVGILGMKVGEKRVLTIPPSLAYGNTERGAIPPNSTLIFDVELVAVQ